MRKRRNVETSRWVGLTCVLTLWLVGCQGRERVQFQVTAAAGVGAMEFPRVHRIVHEVADELQMYRGTSLRDDRPFARRYVNSNRNDDWYVVSLEAFPVDDLIVVNVTNDYSLWAIGTPGEAIFESCRDLVQERLNESFVGRVALAGRHGPPMRRTPSGVLYGMSAGNAR